MVTSLHFGKSPQIVVGFFKKLQLIKEFEMYIDDTYLRRYVSNLCMQIKNRQSPTLQLLFRQRDDSNHPCEVRESVPYLPGEAHESQRFRHLQANYLGIITRLSMCIEMRDPLAAGHTMRLSRYAAAIAEALCWRRERTEELEIGAHLHDIGKVCVTEYVLNKAGRLTSQEMRQIRRHTRFGASMLAKIDFLRPVIPYVLYHHERYDGNGYPFRLSGKDIPVEGRILAVIDTFDALINPRPYRKAMSNDMAIDELNNQKGCQLDPDVVDIFIEVLRKGVVMA